MLILNQGSKRFWDRKDGFNAELTDGSGRAGGCETCSFINDWHNQVVDQNKARKSDPSIGVETLVTLKLLANLDEGLDREEFLILNINGLIGVHC